MFDTWNAEYYIKKGRNDRLKEQKKYCIFAAHYLPHLGGIERYVYNMSETLMKQGDEVVIVTSKVGELSSYEEINNVPVYRLPCYELLDGRYPVVKFNNETRKIFRILKSKRFDVVIINARFYWHSIFAAIFAKKNNIPCIVLEHGSSHLTIHSKLWDMVGRVYEHIHTWVLKRVCNNFYGTCEVCNEWLAHFHIKSRGVIYNAINLDEVNRSLTVKGHYQNHYCIPENAIVVAFTGRLLEEKGLLSLIKAVEEINEVSPRIYLFIAGKGDLEKEVEKRVSEHIIYLGYLEHEEIFRLLDESDIYCLPSDSEAFCGGVLEAIACKCYIITTSQGGIKELLTDDSMGTIIDRNDVNTVRNAIEWCMKNREMCNKAVEKAYDKLVNNFTWDRVVGKMRNLKF